ncbi:uncharacterized protein B0I36DRAFT_7285 [Microdochium trichocladiopsis]|uniref:F-box domain-containing protein n=1 Tax=Microdochium trichocladiopsis TaxID=1682393 RepID=A0A9P9BVG1_9PEZI|nr:uncharacterized protein B0I36DRAFT_7285 [Microdochium trichocladiopsis]KAH7040228.1 hypothetical protein B0I36DRAFT_7285 [Microdochium trichocladiopsis]
MFEVDIFGRLPPELRFMIYGYVFQDAVAEVLSPTEGESTMSFKLSSHWSIMATCRLCYSEGRELYWQKLRLHASRGQRPGCELSDLLERMPRHAKPRLRHLRNLWISQRPSNETRADQSAADLLGQLPRLETCGLCVVPVERPREIIIELDSPKFPANMTQEGCLSSEFPAWVDAFVAGKEEPVSSTKVKFLLKFGGPPLCRHLPDSWDFRSAYHPIQAAYINLSTRRYFAVSWLHDSKLDDEYGFRQVLVPP